MCFGAKIIFPTIDCVFFPYFEDFSSKKKEDPKIIFIFCPANVYRYTRS